MLNQNNNRRNKIVAILMSFVVIITGFIGMRNSHKNKTKEENNSRIQVEEMATPSPTILPTTTPNSTKIVENTKMPTIVPTVTPEETAIPTYVPVKPVATQKPKVNNNWNSSNKHNSNNGSGSHKPAATAKPTNKPVAPAEPTETIKPTATTKPTATPRPTTKPTATPRPTTKPTASAKPTETVKPTGTPKPTSTPCAHKTVNVGSTHYTSNDNGTHMVITNKQCADCGADLTESHSDSCSFGSFQNNGSNEIRSCSLCGYSETRGHSMSGYQNNGADEINTCSTCGYSEHRGHSISVSNGGFCRDLSQGCYYKVSSCSTCNYSSTSIEPHQISKEEDAYGYTERCVRGCGYVNTVEYDYENNDLNIIASNTNQQVLVRKKN